MSTAATSVSPLDHEEQAPIAADSKPMELATALIDERQARKEELSWVSPVQQPLDAAANIVTLEPQDITSEAYVFPGVRPPPDYRGRHSGRKVHYPIPPDAKEAAGRTSVDEETSGDGSAPRQQQCKNAKAERPHLPGIFTGHNESSNSSEAEEWSPINTPKLLAPHPLVDKLPSGLSSLLDMPTSPGSPVFSIDATPAESVVRGPAAEHHKPGKMQRMSATAACVVASSQHMRSISTPSTHGSSKSSTGSQASGCSQFGGQENVLQCDLISADCSADILNESAKAEGPQAAEPTKSSSPLAAPTDRIILESIENTQYKGCAMNITKGADDALTQTRDE